MTGVLDGKLVIAISSRALFNLDEANKVYEDQGIEAYRDYQRANEGTILEPGTGFALVRGLLAISDGRAPLVEVAIFSKNSADSAMRVFKSIQAHGLPITRGVFRNGRDPWPFLPVFDCDLFLSAEKDQVLKARKAGVAAAMVLPTGTPPAPRFEGEVRIAMDGDAVLFDAESEKIYARDGIEAFRAHEAANADVPMEPGPFRGFLEGLARIQKRFPIGESPIRTALVTARDAPAHFRVINTLRAWNVDVDETYFLGGVEKAAVVEAFGAHIFFDDQLRHLETTSLRTPSAQVLWPDEAVEKPVGREPLASVAPIRGRRRRRKSRATQTTTMPLPSSKPEEPKDGSTPTGSAQSVPTSEGVGRSQT